MIHNVEHIRSLTEFMKNSDVKALSYDMLLNRWMAKTGNIIHDAETIDYYLQLIPLIERRLKFHVTVIR